MEWMAGAAAVFVLLLILAGITPVSVTLHVLYQKKQQDIRVKITMWHVFYKTIHLPMIALEEETGSIVMKEETKSTPGKSEEKDIKETPEEMKSQMESFRLWLSHVNELRPLLFSFLNKWKIKKLCWRSRFGTGDAAWTGFLSGSCWTVKHMAVGLLSAVCRLKCTPEVEISPDFQNQRFEAEFLCMVTVRLGHAIITGIRVLKHLKGNVFALWQKAKAETRREEAS
ncbi:DUF2953 domain-containing protein [Salibacterium aidingense]|uniref:DUF2953 domain-containing protein n=1 Tax=Salibacterium aidingense TaxID=384933 RepID=UPI0004177DE8|nr:DUF2953 domain-containing protein [Salibacterium aidingense]